MTNRYLILTVLYKTEPVKCATVQALKRVDSTEIQLVFWDNLSSSKYQAQIQKEFCGDAVYLSNDKNEKLSVIYNYVVQNMSFDAILILDDDTYFEPSYVDEFLNTDLEISSITVPRIYHDGLLISPGTVSGIKGKRIDLSKPGSLYNKAILAMMSGTFITRDVFCKIMFDERLAFYGVDTKFFRDAFKANIPIIISDHSVNHDSALRNVSNRVEHINRLNNLLSSKRIVFEDLLFTKLRIRFYSIIIALKGSIKYRSFEYLKLAIVRLNKTE